MSSDPLKRPFPSGIPYSAMADIPSGYLPALIEARDRAGFKPAQTAHFLGILVTQALGKIGPELNSLPPMLGETPVYNRIRNTLGALTANGTYEVARSDLAADAQTSLPMVSLFVKWATRAGLVAQTFGVSRSGRPSWVLKLSPLGLRYGEKDHPDESVRFTLGGMVPEPTRAPQTLAQQEALEAALCSVCRASPCLSECPNASEPQPE